MGGGGFGGKGGKYKKIILAVFPSDPAGEPQMHNVSKLVHFCELTPQKLPKVAMFLEKRVDADLAKSRLGYVEISMKIFSELIKGCRKHLPLFVERILKLIRMLLEKNEYPELKIIATETFIRFAEVHDETAQYGDLEVFVGYFISMCNNTLNNDHMRRRLRMQGLKGLRAYIGILDVVDELDAFVSRQSSTKSLFFPTILENMQYSEPASSEAGLTLEEEQRATANVKGLSIEVLRDLASRVNNITVTSLTSAVLSYLDIQDKWIPNTFAVECLRTISFSLNSQHNQIMMTKVLQHLEVPHLTGVTQQIVSTIVSIASESTGPVVIVLSSLMKLLVATIQEAAQTPPAADVEEKLVLQQILIDCVGAVSKKFSSAAQKVEAMGFILSLYEENASRAFTGSFTLALVLAECVLAVGAHLVSLPSECVPVHLFSILLELAIHSDPTVRVYAQRIIHCLLLPGRSLGQLVSIPSSDMTNLMGPGCDDLILHQGSALRDTLLATAEMRTNQPENYAAILHTMTILLYRARDKELQHSIPLILKMQHKFQKKKRSPPLQARSLQTLVAAYFLLVARVYNCNPLENYVHEVLALRQEQGQVCRYLELKTEGLVCLLVKTKKYSESAKHRSVSIFFDKDKVISLLSEIPALQQEYGVENFQNILSRKYRTRGKVKSEDSPMPTPITQYTSASLMSRGLPPLTPQVPYTQHDTYDDGTSVFAATKKSGSPQCADIWPLAINTVVDDAKVLMKAVSVDGLRKILEGRDHLNQTDSVTLLFAGERDFTPAALRCAEVAVERVKTHARILGLALGVDNIIEQDNSADSVATVSEVSALQLDLLGPLGHVASFCD